jgi:hypothetical protein
MSSIAQVSVPTRLDWWQVVSLVATHGRQKYV